MAWVPRIKACTGGSKALASETLQYELKNCILRNSLSGIAAESLDPGPLRMPNTRLKMTCGALG